MVITRDDTAWAENSLRRSSELRELRDAARALDGPGANILIGPNFLACVAVLVREHLHQAERGRISVAALTLARQVNDQAARVLRVRSVAGGL